MSSQPWPRSQAAVLVISPSPGKEATFALKFPMVAAGEPVVASTTSPAGDRPGLAGKTVHSANLGGPQVLLVNEHADTLRSMERRRRLRGYRVSTASSAAAAAGPFDLLISDLGLPDGSGMDLMRELRLLHGENLTGNRAQRLRHGR